MFQVLIAVICIFTHQALSASVPQVNFQPIIGVLALQDKLNRINDSGNVSLIGGSYVKFLEAGGARVVPIFIKRPREYYEELLQQLNGVLLPGGAAELDADIDGYGQSVDYIYDIAKRFNDNGDYFPLWGTCLGFEVLAYQDAGKTRDVLTDCFAFNVAYPLQFQLENGRLYRDMPLTLRKATEMESLTFNIHMKCITRKTLEEARIKNNWRVLSTNRDSFGAEFVSSFEHVDYPFYGTQFHPEKNPFEWSSIWKIPHSESAVELSHYYARFFVNEARKSTHRFSTKEDEIRHLIYNFPATFTGGETLVPIYKRMQFEQTYLFDLNSDYAQ